MSCLLRSGILDHLNWSRLSSAFSRFSSRYGSGKGSSKGQSTGSDISKKHHRHARYAYLWESGLLGYERAPVKLMRTYVRTGKTDEVDEDGIRLQYDVEQESAPNPYGVRHK